MQSREQTTWRETGRNGLAVPIALLALLVIGVLVTGAFYVFSHEPDGGDAREVTVGQNALPTVVGDTQPSDSVAPDSVESSPDTSGWSSGADSAPLSTTPASALPARQESAAATLSAPTRPGQSAGTPRSDTLHDR